MSSTAKHPGYKKMKDTPWITQGREIADIGGKGILSNYGNVDVFDQDTKNSLEARNNATYQRAFNDMSKNYNDMMNAYAARNYNRFGSLNNTPSAYGIDEYKKDFQRQMNDASYNKAINYDNLINNELNRRYNTLNMYQNMYGYGQTPHELDIANWNIENTNRDIAYKNALASQLNSPLNMISTSFFPTLGSTLGRNAANGMANGISSLFGQIAGGNQ